MEELSIADLRAILDGVSPTAKFSVRPHDEHPTVVRRRDSHRPVNFEIRVLDPERWVELVIDAPKR